MSQDNYFSIALCLLFHFCSQWPPLLGLKFDTFSFTWISMLLQKKEGLIPSRCHSGIWVMCLRSFVCFKRCLACLLLTPSGNFVCWKCQMQSKSSVALYVQDLGWFQCERSPLCIFLWQSKLQFLWKRCRNEGMDPSTQRGGCHHGRFNNLFFLSLRGRSCATVEVSDPPCLGEGSHGGFTCEMSSSKIWGN